MKIAVIGSRKLQIDNIGDYIMRDCDEIVSGGAKGVDACAAKYAKENNIKITEFLPNYKLYGRAAPIKRNYEIVDYADVVVVFWDGISKGSSSVINYAKKIGKPCRVITHSC